MSIARRTFFRALVLFAITAAACLAIERGEPAPHFVAKTLDGEKLSSESLKGKVVLIEFWATWCPPCRQDAPAVESIIKDFEKQGLVVLAVNMGEPRHKVKKYLEESPKSAKVVLAQDTTLAAICQANAYPLYVVVDREGTVAGTQRGAGGERALRRLIAQAGLESADEN